MKHNNIETRIIKPSEEITFRAIEEDGKKFLIGYASVFNQRSKLIFENGKLFYEVIDRSAFDDVLSSGDLDVYLVTNHNRDKVSARTVNGTLELSTDERGLLFKAEISDKISYSNDLYELVRSGLFFENSFAFAVDREGQEWSQDDEGNNIRIIKKVSRLYDVSVVTTGAYANTDIAARHYEETLEEPDNTEQKRLENEIEILKIKNKIMK